MMYMNEETKRKLNSTQTIADNMDNIIEAFVTYYGEENRERITNRFSNMIIAGHTRLKASKKLGLKQVPCIVADDLSEDQVKAFRLVENKTNELATWDDELLMKELENIDINMGDFGFELGNIEDIDIRA